MNFNFSAGKLREILSMAESCYVCGESLLPNSGRRVMSDQLKSFLRLEVSSGHLYLCKTCYSKTNKGANQEAAACSQHFTRVVDNYKRNRDHDE